MKIEHILRQHRRDFTAVYLCEHCGTRREGSGYDDAHFHENVIPSMACKTCGESSPDSYRPLTTKHPEGKQL